MPMPSVRFITITPELAKKWLDETNTQNRKIITARVNSYARQMTEGSWTANGETIAFSEDGRLLNGQHRLLACIESGVSFISSVTTGVDNDAYPTYDDNAVKAGKDALSYKKVTEPAATSAAAKLIYNYENDVINSNIRVTPKEIEDVVESHAGLAKIVQRVRNLPKGLNIASVSFMMYAASALCPDKVNAMFTKLATGADLKPGDPILALRNKFLAGDKLPENDKLALCIKTLNGVASSQPVLVLKYVKKEKFPTIKGLPIGLPIVGKNIEVENKDDEESSKVTKPLELTV